MRFFLDSFQNNNNNNLLSLYKKNSLILIYISSKFRPQKITLVQEKKKKVKKEIKKMERFSDIIGSAKLKVLKAI